MKSKIILLMKLKLGERFLKTDGQKMKIIMQAFRASFSLAACEMLILRMI